MIQPFPSIRVHIHPHSVTLLADTAWYALSSALLGSGFTEFRSLFIYRVDKEYDHPEPWRHLREIALEKQFPSPTIGLLTAVSLERTQLVRLEESGLSVCAIVTAGVSNATCAGLTLPVALGKAHTINIVTLVNCALSPAAMVNAVITLTEAKTDTLNRLGVRTPGGEIASGTSTDAVVVAHNGVGEPLPYAGPATTLGWLMGRAVRLALTQALG
ncbi:MAG: adenosylcobinamide amidohydrolase [Anaerolineales bacterium]|nr:adenosylcobinamide amidohydrolase [Anaerolineales bacterium]MCS7249156.1 adenosylcobinamide amidohydrolase [Anaerolineales bacterium]MDW8162969.1 adenosylcobinamide amidohydrolase [Anaerolineales bacterium]MDW8445884.1 adenosylcobinamide amidohydrolase [Anaerolineales bacterium]